MVREIVRESTGELLPVLPEYGAALLRAPAAEMLEILAENVGGQLSASDLTRLLPRYTQGAGGMPVFVRAGDRKERRSEITGTLLKIVFYRQWYARPYESGAHELPSCVSLDLIRGVGMPGLACASCPLDRWYEAGEVIPWMDAPAERRTRPCRQRVAVFIQEPEQDFPTWIDLTGLSISSVKAYGGTLARLLLRTWQCVTTVCLADSDRYANSAEFRAEIVGLADYADPEYRAGVERAQRLCDDVMRIYADSIGAGEAPEGEADDVVDEPTRALAASSVEEPTRVLAASAADISDDAEFQAFDRMFPPSRWGGSS